MSIVKCPECQKDISNQAITCPHCGYSRLYFDTEIYKYLNWPADIPLKLNLGE